MKKIKVKRTGASCCGMETGKIYNAFVGENEKYIVVELEDYTLTTGHTLEGYFEIHECDRPSSKCEEIK